MVYFGVPIHGMDHLLGTYNICPQFVVLEQKHFRSPNCPLAALTLTYWLEDLETIFYITVDNEIGLKSDIFWVDFTFGMSLIKVCFRRPKLAPSFRNPKQNHVTFRLVLLN